MASGSSPIPPLPARRHAGGMNTTTTNHEASNSGTTSHDAGHQRWEQTLHRPVRGRMLGGVAAGLADYFGTDATIVRIIFAVLTVVGGAGVPAYIACWLLIPDEGTEQSIASRFLQSVADRRR